METVCRHGSCSCAVNNRKTLSAMLKRLLFVVHTLFVCKVCIHIHKIHGGTFIYFPPLFLIAPSGSNSFNMLRTKMHLFQASRIYMDFPPLFLIAPSRSNL